jgi:transcription initiation factor TFIIIB Brf1 subunit/transcription initiation factor TFIIB
MVVVNDNSEKKDYDDDTDDWFLIHNTKNICRACHTIKSIRIDWSQGDRICTFCGVVQEERIIDRQPEWRDYGDRDDRCGGGGTDDLLHGSYRARTGMVPNNERKYIGGLQPTTLSRSVYSGTNGVRKQSSDSNTTNIAQRLRKVHRKIESRMFQQNKVAMKTASLNLQLVRKRQRQEVERRDQMTTTTTNTTDADTENTDTINDEEEDVLPDYGSNVEWTEERIYTTKSKVSSSSSSSEYEQLVQEQERQVAQHREALYANKWSLDRAKQLFGSSASNNGCTNHSNESHNIEDIERDPILYTAAQDIFIAYTLICTACCTTLQLPMSIIDEATALLCQYASRRDGFKVKGIASTTATSNSTTTSTAKHNALMTGKRWGRSSYQKAESMFVASSASTPKSEQELDDVKQMIRQQNKTRQMASLCAAILFWIARYRHKPRTILAVCDSIVYNANEKVSKKHCSRALQELKLCFPELLRLANTPSEQTSSSSSSTILTQLRKPKFTVPEAICVQQENMVSQEDSHMDVSVIESMANMIEHTIQKLHLPPVAEASIRYLCIYHYIHTISKNESYHYGTMAKLVPIHCAAIAYLISTVGHIMQQLARQSQQKQDGSFGSNGNQERVPSWSTITSVATKKMKPILEEVKEDQVMEETSMDLFADDDDRFMPPMDDYDTDARPDRAMSQQAHPTTTVTSSISSLSSSTILAEQRAYEMRRMWDAWLEQIPWDRTIVQIEQSTNVSKKVMVEYYKRHYYPDRFLLLEVLRDAVKDSTATLVSTTIPTETSTALFLQHERTLLKQTPLSSIVLSNIVIAAALLKNDVKL